MTKTKTSVYKTYNHCPRCGARLAWRLEVTDETRRQTCSSCNYQVYHNPIAAAEAYIIRNEQISLLRRARYPRLGSWDIPGGFLEVNEDPKHGLRREVREELNVALIRPVLFGAYSTHYKFQQEVTSVIVMTYVADIKGRIRLNHENSELAWMPLNKARKLAFIHQQQALKDLRRVLKQQPK